MSDKPAFKKRKNDTSITAERAALIICKTPLNLSNRTTIAGYAIDSAMPDTPMDRDDAVALEYKTDPVHGKVTIMHITIADVAASSPRGAHKEPNLTLAALDQDAQTNGETMYFNFGISPMLPETLQNRLSLENGQERAGLTISVTLDQDANIVHTEFSRTIIRAHCKSYQDASKDIAVHAHPLQQLSVVAKHVLKKKSSITDLPHYDPLTGMYTDSEGNTRHINIDELSAYTTVQGCMIAANEAAAGIMRDSNFMFRNHSYTPRDRRDAVFYNKDALEQSGGETKRPIQNKAEYSAECNGHYGLNAPMYSHVTSPIRRYADLVNQRMMHWAIDVVEATQAQIAKGHRHHKPGWDNERIAHHIWENATQLLGDITEYKQSRGNLRTIAAGRLEHTIAEIAQAVPGIGGKTASEIARQTLASIDEIDLPYTHKEVSALAKNLNHTLEQNKQVRRAVGYSETEAWLNAVFPDTQADKLLDWNPATFARLLEGAAKRGDNNEIFAAEVIKRFDSDKEFLVKNLHSVLVVAERRNDVHWQALKKHAFQRLKDDPQLAEQVFAYMQDMQRRQSQPSGTEKKGNDISTYILEATLLDDNKHHYPAALVVLSNNGVDYSASIIDKANTPEEARQGAILTFFRQYGNLHPHDTQYTPKLIELALKRAKMKKGERFETLQHLCKEHFTIDLQYTISGSERDKKSSTVTLTVTNNETGEQLSFTRIGPKDAVPDKLAKDVLYDRRFHNMLTRLHNGVESEYGVDTTNAAPIIWTQSQHMERLPDEPHR